MLIGVRQGGQRVAASGAECEPRTLRISGGMVCTLPQALEYSERMLMVSYICIHSSYQEVTNKVMVQWQRCAACVCSGGHASGWTAVVTHLRVQCRMHRREQSAYVMLRDDVFVLWRAARTRAEGSWADRTPSWCGAWACKECFLTHNMKQMRACEYAETSKKAQRRKRRNFEENATKKANTSWTTLAPMGW